MPIQPEHLVTFARVAHEGSVTRAAEALHRSQPALSQQLRSLVDAVGEPLYRRHRDGVELTDAGRALLPHAQAVGRALAGAAEVAAELRGLRRGTLRVTASMTVAVYLLPRLLARFHRRHPGLELQLLTRNSREAVALLARGEAEVCFVEGPLTDVGGDVVSREVFGDELVLVLPPDHPLAGRRTVNAADLATLALVRREPGSGTREVVARSLAELGVEPPTALEATGLEAVKEAVLNGLGGAFLSRLAVRRELAAELLVEVGVEGVSLERPMTLLHPRRPLASGAARAFLDLLDEEPGGGGMSGP